MDELLLQLLSKLFGMTEEQAADLLYQKSEDGKVDKTKLNDGALEALLSKDKARIAEIKKTEKTQAFNDAHDKAKKEVLTKAEKQIAEKYGVEYSENLKLDDIIEALIAEKTKGKDGSAKTDEDVKKHPAYLALEKARTKEIEQMRADYEAKLKEVDQKHQKQEVLGKVKVKGLSYLDAMKPVLPKDMVKAQTQRKDFEKLFDVYEYQQDGDDYLLIKDGKRVEDEHGNPVTLKNFVKNQAELRYEFVVQDPKGNAGNEPGGGKGGDPGAGGFKVPTNQQEFDTAIINATTAEERTKITEAYEAAKES